MKPSRCIFSQSHERLNVLDAHIKILNPFFVNIWNAEDKTNKGNNSSSTPATYRIIR